jgi:hypothetical protein
MTPPRPAATDHTNTTNTTKDTADWVDELLGELAAAGGFPSGLLLRCLTLIRAVVAGSATRRTAGSSGSPSLLQGLHLDLAAIEVADAAGLTAADPGDDLDGVRVDGPAQAAAGRLLDRCAERIQERLNRGGRDLGADQLLALTRAVLHLDAVRRASRAGDPTGAVP